MKVTKVYLLPASIKIEAISLGRNVTVEAPTLRDVAKKAMKEDHYFSRDDAIITDINQVLWEQVNGVRENPNRPASTEHERWTDAVSNLVLQPV